MPRSRARVPYCPECGHRTSGIARRAVERLIWTSRCCHALVDDPYSYDPWSECGCESELHRKRLRQAA